MKSTLTILFIINIFIQKEHTAAPLWSFIGIGLEITVTPDDLKTAYILWLYQTLTNTEQVKRSVSFCPVKIKYIPDIIHFENTIMLHISSESEQTLAGYDKYY